MFEFKLSKKSRKRKAKAYFKDHSPSTLPPIRRIPDIEPHDILLDKLAQKKEEELGISEKKFEVPVPKKILQGFWVISLILISLLFLKTFQLQVLEGKHFFTLAEENKFIIYLIQAERGVIYDRNLNQLVWNKPSFDLVLDVRDLPQSDFEKTKVLKEISEIIDKNLENLEKEISESESSRILISEGLDHKTLIILETKIREFPGFQIVKNPIRNYKDGEIFAHLIGYTGKIRSEELKADPENYSIFDYVGRDGLEKSYEKILRKNPGKLRIEKDVLSNIISKEIIQFPEPGKSLVLWLDSELQEKIKEELEKGIRAVGAKKGAAVVLDPKTGGVLALVSIPDFNNNLFQKGSDPVALANLLIDPKEPLFNRAISGKYPVGSTIKPLIASAALEEKIIRPEKQINCQGLIQVPHEYIPEVIYEYKDWRVHDWTGLKKAIAESCNVYFYTVGGGYGKQEGLGPSRIKKYLELFGWGNKTQINLPGEEEGLIPDPIWKKSYFERKEDQVWRDGDTYNLSIGQGYISVTPLQVATGFAAIANNGKLLKPQVVQKIVDSEKNLIEEIEPETIRQGFIDPKNLQIVREGMRQAVTGENSPHASAVLLNSLPVSSAAKTGTAELENDYYHNWVTVIAPYDNPQIVLTLVIENVKEAQVAALPLAQRVLNWYFTQGVNF
ncbi:penicillin-binding protein 2 [Patescibacteria group bacterium]|nr:penicillin-binding protein 2 [Patescibacteria group bacterium]